MGLIYNGMIAPMGSFGLKGVAWYQGESDVGVTGYDKRLAALFKGWRTQFRDPNLPMLIVQLPNFGPVATAPVDSGWAALREEQRRAVAADSRAALIVTLDLGEAKNLHPLNKAPVGARLAAASVIAYGDPVRTTQPEVESARRERGSIRVDFRFVMGALHSWSDARAIGFELCAETLSKLPLRRGDTVRQDGLACR